MWFLALPLWILVPLLALGLGAVVGLLLEGPRGAVQFGLVMGVIGLLVSLAITAWG